METAEELVESVKAGDRKKVKMILDVNPDLINYQTERGETLVILASYHGSDEVLDFILSRDKEYNLNIHEACAIGKKDQVRELLYEVPSLLNSFSPEGNTPLLYACYFGHLDVVSYLVSKGAKVNAKTKNEESQTALHAAISGKNLNVVKFLLENGADVNSEKADCITPMHLAAESNQIHIVKILMIHRANINARMEGDLTPLTLAKTNEAEDVVRLLMQKGAIE
jgi:uncharacterized protein